MTTEYGIDIFRMPVYIEHVSTIDLLIGGKMEKLLGFANTSLLAFTVGLLVTVLLAYPFASSLSIAVQVAAHIGTLIFATGIKIAYVTRLVSLKHLGRPVH